MDIKMNSLTQNGIIFIRLTEWSTKNRLEFAEKQLKKEGAKEGRDYIWYPRGKYEWAIFILKKVPRAAYIPGSAGLDKVKGD